MKLRPLAEYISRVEPGHANGIGHARHYHEQPKPIISSSLPFRQRSQAPELFEPCTGSNARTPARCRLDGRVTYLLQMSAIEGIQRALRP